VSAVPNNEEHRKIVKFLITGALRTAASYGVFLLALWAGLGHTLALVADCIFAMTLGYVLNRSWTFASQGRPAAPIPKYIAAYVIAFGVNWVPLELLVREGVNPAPAQIPCLALATVASYILQRYWVFKGH